MGERVRPHLQCHLARNLRKGEYTAKVGITATRLKAGGDAQYLLKVLTT